MTKRTNELKATCANTITVSGSTAPEWVQLLPFGEVKPQDSRKGWTVKDIASIISASASPLAIDYDHGTDREHAAESNSRAAGWMTELKDGGPAGEPGLWAKVDWTPSGGKAIAEREYRYISPVFMHDKQTHEVTRVLRAALTNNPALELKALASQEQETDLNLKALAAKLGLPETATEAEVLAAIETLTQTKTALASKTKLLSSVATAAGLAADKDIGDTEVTAICAKLKTPSKGGETEIATLQKQVDDLNIELASFKKGNAEEKAKAAVDAAIADGKLPPAQKEWAISYCSRDPEGFNTFIGKQAKVLPDGRIAPTDAKDGVLSAEEKQICAQLGLSEDDYKKELASRKREAA